jgi:hypothetical protein
MPIPIGWGVEKPLGYPIDEVCTYKIRPEGDTEETEQRFVEE